MFDFKNLDDIENDAAIPEYLKWKGVPEWQKSPEEGLAILEDDREDFYASPDFEDQVVQATHVYRPPLEAARNNFVCEKLEIPVLPDDNAFDPLSLAEETADAINEQMASLNGQVIVNFALGAVEELRNHRKRKEEHKAYIDQLQQARMQDHERTTGRPFKKSGDLAEGQSRGVVLLDRKPFSWRELTSSLPIEFTGLGNDVYLAEAVLTGTSRTLRSITPVSGYGAMLSPPTLVHLLSTVAAKVRPVPPGLRRMQEWHLAICDVFSPTPFFLTEGSDYIEGREVPPTLVHLVAMSVQKELNPPEAGYLLQTIKLPSSSSYPSVGPRL
eukprot:TRINITY_DN37811_c0_g1_i1.p1 TRINITY_DN37811_c0_g1~~TRINITY_DN37811_c0_g1_i1.p1  ORF type:complete len:328 (+),score=66.34 TRINITY_DN37811_c0_g1_i1:89-1072(+)